MHYHWDYLTPTSSDILPLEECPINMWKWWDFGCITAQSIAEDKPTTSDRLIANRETVGNLCTLQSYPAGFMLGIMYKLAATYSNPSWSLLYIRQDFPLLFVIIFLSYSILEKHGYTTISARWRRIRSKLIDRCFVQDVTPRHTAGTETPVSPPWHFQWSHPQYDPGCTFINSP